ncbi:DUF4913 domain-containing protein [Nocardia alni]|uniref:DUF4913 domain-containing protein n=1 Tax=Nocardia alni TaxID=2815723 RepID=UPI0027DF16D7|nr:DUF4913 domain-containing protein [Nocardia alni]
MTQPEESTPTHFRNVAAFVDEYLRYIYQRQVTDTTDAVWCPEWWKHTEAVVRLDSLWRAWEHYRLRETTGLSIWFTDHADPHMTKLLDPSGPFKYCNARHGHRQLLAPLPLTSPPREVFDWMAPLTPPLPESSKEKEPVDRVYASVVEFVENYLSVTYQRQVTDTTETVWCPEWWRHPEAIIRLDSLWRAWEFFRQKAPVGLSEWFLTLADPQMKQLLDPRGPFRYCSARHGHKELLTPLPSAVSPGMFTDPDDARDYRV